AAAAQRTLSASGEPGYAVLLSLANVAAWVAVSAVLSRMELAWSSYALIALAAFAMQLPPWLRARRLRRQLDAALFLLAQYEHPMAADETSRAPSPVSQRFRSAPRRSDESAMLP
ncbi:MAG TPA: hypothetical protein VN153_12400, partial [Tahibacter sp.]|nr:hypothetical protein [Tahibacter sp.]